MNKLNKQEFIESMKPMEGVIQEYKNYSKPFLSMRKLSARKEKCVSTGLTYSELLNCCTRKFCTNTVDNDMIDLLLEMSE